MSKNTSIPLPVIGIDVLSNETALLKGAVRSAVNVDIGRAGRFQRRVGQTLRVPGTDFHSLWASVSRGTMFVGNGPYLMRLRDDMTTAAFANLNSGEPLSYTEYNGNIYWTNKSTLGWLPANTVYPRAVGVPTPEVTPSLSATNGSMLPGTYAVCMSYVDDRGEEGGTTTVQTISLPNGGGITLSNLPIHASYLIKTYVTDADGSKLYANETFPASFPSYALTQVSRGEGCETQFLVPMPPGDFITWLAGRLYTAVGGALRFSEPMRPHLYNPARDAIQFSGNITFIEAVTDGIYVGDNRGVWFLSGTDPSKFTMQRANPHLAVTRSSIKVGPGHFPAKMVPSTTGVAVWLSSAGYVAGMDGGITVELQPERLLVPSGLSGRSAFVIRGGVKQVITPVNSPTVAASGIAVDSGNWSLIIDPIDVEL